MDRQGIVLLARSAVWETEPVGSPDPRWYLNMAAEIRTELEPHEVLDRLLAIERSRGRVRAQRNAPRELDLDLLWMDGCRREGPDLFLPHPRMWSRRFVMAPLAEIAPDLTDPGSGRTVSEILAGLPEVPSVRRLGSLAPPRGRPV